MHRTRIKRITLAVLCVTPLLRERCSKGSCRSRSARRLSLPRSASSSPLPVFIEADRLEARGEKEAEAEGNVRLRR